MELFILTILAGVNLAYSILSFFIWRKNKKQYLYLYFFIFSFFSGLYIFLNTTSGIIKLNIRGVIIFSAACYYAIFPWFIFAYTNIKRPKTAIALSVVFLIAFLLFFTDFTLFGYPLWIIIAHIGLIGLIIVSYQSCLILKKKKNSNSIHLQILVIIFAVLGFEEIITQYLKISFLSNSINGILPLDIFPLLFSIIIGRKLSKDIYMKTELEMSLSKSRLKAKQLSIDALQKKILEQKLNFKNKDLTDFGMKLSNYKGVLQDSLTKLVLYQKENEINDKEFSEIIERIKSHVRIEGRNQIFNGKVDAVNHEFMSKAKKTYPSLTENDLNLLSLLKLRLSTKEIASVKNISPDSVKVLRSRLRKKLNLETSINLTEFVNSM